jgi:hypothetical protein
MKVKSVLQVVVKGSKWIGVKRRESQKERRRVDTEGKSICSRGSSVAGVQVMLTQEISRGLRCWNLEWLSSGRCPSWSGTIKVNGLWSTPRLSHQTVRPFWEKWPRGTAMVNARCSVIYRSESSAIFICWFALRPLFTTARCPLFALDGA